MTSCYSVLADSQWLSLIAMSHQNFRTYKPRRLRIYQIILSVHDIQVIRWSGKHDRRESALNCSQDQPAGRRRGCGASSVTSRGHQTGPHCPVRGDDKGVRPQSSGEVLTVPIPSDAYVLRECRGCFPMPIVCLALNTDTLTKVSGSWNNVLRWRAAVCLHR